MATYKEIKGKTVQSLTSDIDNATGEGQIWYNTTDSDYNTIVGVGSWASGGSLNVARTNIQGGGTQTAAVGYGSSTGLSALTEEYNGASWSVANTLTTTRKGIGGFGIQTAAIGAGGYLPAVTDIVEEYDGTNWTETGDLNTGRAFGKGSGTTTAAIFHGGRNPGYVANAEQWNGTGWTVVAPINTARASGGTAGTSTACLGYGGYTGTANLQLTEEYNGSSWTEVADLNTGRSNAGSAGLSTTALAFGGQPAASTANTEIWNGVSWTEVNNLPAGMDWCSNSIGTSDLALSAGGHEGTAVSAVTNEWTFSTLAAGTWSTAPTINSARLAQGGIGSQTANVIYGGYGPPPSPSAIKSFVEEYNGTSWTEVNNIPTAIYRNAGMGTLTAGLTMPGRTAGNTTETYQYDGTNWTETGDYPTPTSRCCAAGTQTAGLGYSGYNPAGDKTSEYDGSTWTEVNNVGTARYNSTFGGLQTAALFITGGDQTPPTTALTNVEDYDGTNWTETNAINTARKELGSTIQGTPSAFMIQGGSGSPAAVEIYDGTTWSTSTSIPAGKDQQSGGGTLAAGLMTAGGPGTGLDTVFEWTGPSQDVKTITD